MSEETPLEALIERLLHIAVVDDKMAVIEYEIGDLLPRPYQEFIEFLRREEARARFRLDWWAMIKLAEEDASLVDTVHRIHNAVAPVEDFEPLLKQVRLELKRIRARQLLEEKIRWLAKTEDEGAIDEILEREHTQTFFHLDKGIEIADDGRVFPTGIRALDSVWRGRPGELALFLGATGSGKSVILQNLAVCYAQHKFTTLLIDIELPREVVVRRLYSIVHRVPIARTFAQTKLVLRLDMPLTLIDAPGSYTIPQLEAAIQRLKPDVVIIDYLQLMTPVRVSPEARDWEVQMRVARDVRRIARKYEVLIVSALQVTREGIDREQYSLRHVSRSFAYATDANFLAAFVHRQNELHFHVLKSTNTESGTTFNLGADFSMMRIFDPNERPALEECDG